MARQDAEGNGQDGDNLSDKEAERRVESGTSAHVAVFVHRVEQRRHRRDKAKEPEDG